MKVTCSFSRLGSNADVPPLVAAARDGDWRAVEGQVWRYACTYLPSDSLRVELGPDGGNVWSGQRMAGKVSVEVEPTPPVREDLEGP